MGTPSSHFVYRDPVEYLKDGSGYLADGKPPGWYFHEPRSWWEIEGPYPTEAVAREALRNYCDAMVALGPW